ncbi:flagellar filament capping protein FliD [Clostridium ihumii]|uniref:flagellar filament capping protein FliD n=1 Tax=Clostridium ihumii TaxID=1470356 RepID=UPI003D328592
MRLTGLATGMDTDATIKEMLKPQQTKIDNMKKDQEIVQWQQEIYRDVIKDANNLMSKYFDVLNKDNYLLGSSSLTSTKVTSSNPLLNMTASADAKEGTYSINVEKLATNAKVSGVAGTYKDSENNDTKIDLKTNLSDIGINSTDKLNFKVNGEKVEIDLDGVKTVGDLSKKISNITKGKVSLEYSEISKKFTLSTKETGAEISLEFDENSVDILNKIAEFKDIKDNKLSASNLKVKGEDLTANITIPGDAKEYSIKASNNKFSLDGINFDVSGMEVGKTETITVSKSNDEAVKKIKSFVEDYNKLVDKVNKLNTEKRNYNYKPLTEAEKKDMTDDQIAKWEAKAKQGILKGDNYLNSMLSDLRTSMFGESGSTLFSIGISTTSTYTDGGKLEFDEQKFLKSLNEDPEKTINTFKNGMTKLDETLKNYTSTNNVRITGSDGKIIDAKRKGLLVEKAGYEGTTTVANNVLTKKIKDKQQLIDAQVKKMATMENNYYKQFSNLETVMNKLNSQLGYLTQMMG